MSATPAPDWGAIKALFFAAIELRPEEREAYLARACGADAAMRSEVESLLASHARGPFLEVSPVAGAARELGATLEQTGAMSLAPGTRIGQYEVLAALGSGGMGDVYRARDTKLDRVVALKIVVDSGMGRTLDRVLREARATSALNHPNICTLFEAGEFDGQPYLAMEYVPGKPLSAVIPPGGFETADILRYGAQIADALAHAHEHGVIHRDLKGANVVVTPQGRAKVLDFGLARRLTTAGAGHTSGTFTGAGTITGTLAYMAPELLRDRAADARTDIWALGVLLYELAAGRRPFVGDTTFELTSAIMKDIPPPLPVKVPPALRAVIVRCLARDPDQRFQRASEVLSALEASHPATGMAAPRPIRPARRAVFVLGVAVALFVAAYALYQSRARTAESIHGASRPAALAVLPFQVLSGAEEIGFLGLAVPDTIVSRIAIIRNIRVRRVLKPGKESEDPQGVGRALGVDYVLTGTIQKGSTQQVRITPQLTRVEDGVGIWIRSYTLSSTDMLGLQDQIARAVVEALPVQMTAEDRVSVDRQHTQNAGAHALYLRGRAGLAVNRRGSTEEAVASFQSAIDHDPAYTLAHAGLAIASARMRLFFAKEEEVPAWHTRAHQAAQEALRLDPGLAETHEALAAVYRSTEFDWPQTLDESRQALALNPNLDQPHLFRASAFMHLGLLDRVESEVAAAMDINPANLDEPLRVQGVAAMYAGRYDAAIQLLEQASAASGVPAEWNLAYAYYNAGRKTEAELMLRRVRSDSARTHRRAQSTLASFLAANGQTAEARKLIDDVIAGTYRDHHVAYALGVAYAQLGLPKEALRRLSEARTSGLQCYPWFERDPLLEPLRQNPAFQIFLDEFKQSWGTKKAQFDADR